GRKRIQLEQLAVHRAPARRPSASPTRRLDAGAGGWLLPRDEVDNVTFRRPTRPNAAVSPPARARRGPLPRLRRRRAPLERKAPAPREPFLRPGTRTGH